jgi:Holliday junction resolvase RusA-like endonuclease
MTKGQVRMLKIPVERTKPQFLKQRQAIERCIKNKEALALIAKSKKFTLPDSAFDVIFWMETKVAERWGCGHKQVPDVDNLCKQLFDALCGSDSHIWEVKISKLWCKPGEGRIEIWQ